MPPAELPTGAPAPSLRGRPAFARFWAASTVSDVGSSVTAIAVQVLVLVDLGGTTTELGLVNAARWLPYLVLGLVVGVWADRVRRRPVLVATDLGRAVLLAAVTAAFLLGHLSIAGLVALMVLLGALSLANEAVHQSFLPRLVPAALLTPANARLEQSRSGAQTTGPVVGGALVAWLGAPVAVLVDAFSFLVSGVLTATIRVDEPRRARPAGAARWRVELREGLAWVYRHPTLAPLAIMSHVWFLFFAVLGTVYPAFALRAVGLSALGLGVTLALAGVGGVLGATLSQRAAWRFGVPATVVGPMVLEALGIAAVAASPASDGAGWLAWTLCGGGQLLVGLGLGLGGPVEMAYRQAVTPDRLLGRTNTTMRSINRAAVVVGAPLAGLLADAAGYRVALAVGAAGILLSGVVLAASSFREASGDERAPDDPA